jgi:DNA-binding HxlR family transcriptional regulator
MTRKKTNPRRSGCPVNAALEMLGDSWSLLIIRDLMLFGRKAYREFLEAGEGIATNILADRLAKLEANGIVTRRRDPQDARRIRYRLTEKDMALAPAMLELAVWGATHERTAAPPETIRRMKNSRERVLAEIRARWDAEGETG